MDDRMRMIESEMAKFESEIRAPMARPPMPNRPAMALRFLPHAMMRGGGPPMPMMGGPPMPPPHMMRFQRPNMPPMGGQPPRGAPPLAPLPPRPIASLTSGPSNSSGPVIEGAPTRYDGEGKEHVWGGQVGVSGAPPIKKPKTESSGQEGGPSVHSVEKPGTSQLRSQVLPSDLLEADRRAHQFAADAAAAARAAMVAAKPKKYLRTAGGATWKDPSLAEWDPNDFRIFCGDLGNEVSDELLAKAFRKYSSFQKAKVVRDKRTNKSKGFGFISFKDPQDFTRAIKEMDGKYVGNRPIKLRKSEWKERNFNVVAKKVKKKAKIGLKY